MKTKQLIAIVIAITFGVLLLLYFTIPIIISTKITSTLNSMNGITVKEVHISWLGPQKGTGLLISKNSASISGNVLIQNSLFSLLQQRGDVKATVRGKGWADGEGVDEFVNLSIDIDISASKHISGFLNATHKDGGVITLDFSSPNLIGENYEINPNAEYHSSIDIQNFPIPTISGVGGWTILDMRGNISSPDMLLSTNISVMGDLSEYDELCGTINIKAQLIEADSNNDAYQVGGKDIMGSVQMTDVPTSLFAPFVNTTPIDLLRDLGPKANFNLSRVTPGSPLHASFKSEHVSVIATIKPGLEILKDVELIAKVDSELIEEVTRGEITGTSTVTAKFKRLVPQGTKHGLDGTLQFDEPLTIKRTNTTLKQLKSVLSTSHENNSMRFSGNAICDEIQSSSPLTFYVEFRNPALEKTESVVHSIKELYQHFSNSQSEIRLQNCPTSIVADLLNFENINFKRDVGQSCDALITLLDGKSQIDFSSRNLELNGESIFSNNQLTGFKSVECKYKIEPELAQELTGVKFASPALLTAEINYIDFNGNTDFNCSIDIGEQHTFINGKSSIEPGGNQKMHLALVGIDAHLIDAIGNFNGLLPDTIGTPVAAELILSTNEEGHIQFVSGGTSENAAFETNLIIKDGFIATVANTQNEVDLQLSSALTKHLLKDLGPVLSDIRNVEKPINVKIKNASASLSGDVSKLKADLEIDIGEVALDSGSLSLKLLPLFNSSQVEIVSAKFDPIVINITDGIAEYKEFKLTIAEKYTIPYSGRIDLINRTIDLHSAVPLTGLGYSIKELRGLATDIDVPLRITGTIESPKVDVDPTFDLSKLLQSAAIDAIGNAINDVIEDAPDPIKLLEELLGGK